MSSNGTAASRFQRCAVRRLLHVSTVGGLLSASGQAMACSWRKPAHALVDCHQEWLARGSHRTGRRPRTTAPAPNPSQFQARTPQAALQFEGTLPFMVYDLDLTVMVTTAGIALLGAIYLWSKDPARRDRAWQLLKLLLRRP